MAFWGVEVKPGKPFTYKATEATGNKRLHLSQATLGHGGALVKCTLQCIVGKKSPLYLCVLSPDKVDSCQLNLEFEEADEVVFSVIGPRSIHITGYFLGRSSAFRLNDDESESYGEDIVDTDGEKASSDDYDYSDSFINDDEPIRRRSQVSSTDDDEISIKEMTAKRKDKKKNEKGGRLKRKFRVSDSDSDPSAADSLEILNSDNENTIAKVLSSDGPLPSRTTRSKERSCTLEDGEPNAKCEKIPEAKSHNHKDKTVDKTLCDVEPSPDQKGCELVSEKKSKNERSKSSVVVNIDDEEGKKMAESLLKEKPTTDKEDKSLDDVEISKKKSKEERSKSLVVVNSNEESGENMPESLKNEKSSTDKEVDVIPSQQNGDATLSKKKRKRDRREETKVDGKNLSECSENKKQAIDKNIENVAGDKKPQEPEISSKGVIIEEIEKGNLDGKSAVTGKKVSILYTGKLKDTGKLFTSNLGEAPLRFRLGGRKVIKGLSIGVEGMRVGDKRRLTIPPSLGYSDEGLKEDVPKNAWLVYEVEAVKVR